MKTINNRYISAQPFNKMPSPPETIGSLPVYVIGETEQNGKPTPIRTSAVVAAVADQPQIVTESGSIYELGAPDAHYAQTYPDALTQILEALPIHGQTIRHYLPAPGEGAPEI